MEVMPGFKKTDVGLVPIDWDVIPFIQVTKLITCGIAATPDYVSENIGYPFLSSSNVKNGKIIWKDYKFISQSLHRKLYKNNPPIKGDILYSRVGTFGEAAVVDVDFEFSIYVSLTLIKPCSHLNCFYLAHLLNSTPYKRRAKDNIYLGGGVGNLNVDVVRRYPIVIPPKNEQTAISEALSDFDLLLDSLDRLIAKKRDLKQAAMQQLLTGQTRLPGFSGEWANKQLGDVICEISDGGTPSTSDSRNFGGDVPWVVIDDIKQKITSTRTTLTEKGLQTCAARRWPQGTLIVSTGATIGEVGILQVSAATKQGICGIIFDPLFATPEFMQYWFFNYKKLLLSKAQGSSIKEVRAPTLVTLPLFLPEIAEQTAIATVLSDMDTELTALEVRRNKVSAMKQGMMQELLTGRTRLV